MNRLFTSQRAAAIIAVFALTMSLSSLTASAADPGKKTAAENKPATTQYFQDVPVGSFWYNYTAALYQVGVISGYACGNPPAGPCGNPPLPYYLPDTTVTRGQMAKFVDLARTQPLIHITDSGVLNGTAVNYDIRLDNSTIGANTLEIHASGAYNYGIESHSANSYAGYFTSGGNNALYAHSMSSPAINANGITQTGILAQSGSSYGIQALSDSGVGGYFTSNSNVAGYFVSSNNSGAIFAGATHGIEVFNSGLLPTGLFASSNGGQNADGVEAFTSSSSSADAGHFDNLGSGIFGYALYANGDGEVTGSFNHGLSAGGANASIMQNVSGATLERGDVVTIAASSSDMVMGDVPAVKVELAKRAADGAVVGIVDAPIYIPDAATAAAFAAQEQADYDATIAAANDPAKQAALDARLKSAGRISRDVGRVHNLAGTAITANGYAKVVTQGAYQAIKVDASFGPIQAGDPLTTSPHAGYAMKADAKATANNAIIGKALGSLAKGSGAIAVMVTLR